MFNQLFLFTTTSWFLASLLTIPLLGLLWYRHRERFQVRLADALLLVFVALFSLSFFTRLQPYGYQELVGFTVGPSLYLILRHTKAQEWFKSNNSKIAWGTSIFAGLLSLYGVVTFVGSVSPRLYSLFQGVEAYTTYPNAFALLLLILTPLNFWLTTQKSKNSFSVAGKWGLLILNLTALSLTFSRGALLATIISGAIVVITLFVRQIIGKGFRKTYLITWIVSGIVCFSLITPAFNKWHAASQDPELAAQVPTTIDITDRLADKDPSSDQSTDERWQFWQGSWSIIKAAPWFGVGSDGFRTQYPRVQREILATSTHPHSLALKLAAENGVPAAVAFYLFLLVLAVGTFLHILRNDNCGWQVALFAAFIASNVHLLFDYNLNAMLVWLAFWLVASGMTPKLNPKLFSHHALNYLLSSGLILILAISLWHGFQYRAIKAGDPLAAGYSPFRSVRYEMLGELARDENLSDDELKTSRLTLNKEVRRYPDWDQAWLALARINIARGDYEAGITDYIKAIRLNGGNDFVQHAEYISALQKAGLQDQILQQSGIYQEISRQYIQKLQVNAHNTVASANPDAIRRIISTYIQLTADQDREIWAGLQLTFAKVESQESAKFNKLYP